eukprot:TRINITY_DN5720_c9_g1_i1.p1 TRINITY_DN5720_c9_g1~~TRINITY_DN5720_c9_g1_i1.p1  ORF type:complete len:328 (+),score=46.04 TRINITY_DN5720_c9_g1_i1:49-1032(+)
MLKRLLPKSPLEENRRKVNVVLHPGEEIGLRYSYLKGRRGPKVTDVTPGGAAGRGGIEPGYVLYSVAGVRTGDDKALLEVIERMKAKGGCFTIEVTGARSLPGTPKTTPAVAVKPRAFTQPPGEIPFLNSSFPRSMTKPLLQSEEAAKKQSLTVPKMLEVVCPSQPEVEGTYYNKGLRINGSTVWETEGPQRLYCTRNGLWALVDVADGPEQNIALVSSCSPSRGRTPNQLHWADWQHWDGEAWISAPVRVEELRIDPADGNPYWKGAFVEYYGMELGAHRWGLAAPVSGEEDDMATLPPVQEDEPSSPQRVSSYQPPSLAMVAQEG